MQSFGIAFFFTQQNFLEILPGQLLYCYFLPPYCWLEFPGADEPVCLILHLWKNIWAGSWVFWSLQIKLLWTFMYRFLCKLKFFIFRDKCPGMQMLRVIQKLHFRFCPTVFQSSGTTTLAPVPPEGPVSSHPRQHLELSVFLILAILIGGHERCSPELLT